MKILSLSLQNFRSFPDLTINWAQGQQHLLLGPNGAGKTNLLEALAVLSLTRSFLSVDEQDVVLWGGDFYRVRGEVEDDEGQTGTVEVVSQFLPRKQKACFINDVRTPISDALGHVPTVTFLPQDLELFVGSPALRRRFLDDILCQVSPQYSRALSQYLKILKQRNSLLRRIADGNARRADLASWDTMLAQAGARIVIGRLELIEVFQCALGSEIRSLGEQWQDIQMVYTRKGDAREEAELSEQFCALLQHYQDRDVLLQSTTVGPHRDDWSLMVDDRPLQTFASRGQQRTAVLALLFLKVSFLELRRGEKPLVLLDDVFSELDDHHQVSLLQTFDDYQVFVSATHVPPELHGAQMWWVGEGKVVAKAFQSA
ncbi:MAG: DNA replication and repair protein RecF [Candidatus Peribacteraceae bacterium]